MDTITALADEFHAFHLQSDRMGALWKGNLDTLELWEDFTPDGSNIDGRSYGASLPRQEQPQSRSDPIQRST